MSTVAQNSSGTKYIAIPDVIIRALARRLRSGEQRMIWAILLLTQDNYKMQGYISIRQLMELTNLSRIQVIRSIRDLESKRMIIVSRKASTKNLIRFERNPEKWRVSEKNNLNVKDIQRRKRKYQLAVTKKIELEQGLRYKNGTGTES